MYIYVRRLSARIPSHSVPIRDPTAPVRYSYPTRSLITTAMDGSDLYLRPDTSYVRSPHDDVMPAVVLLIYGTTYALTMSVFVARVVSRC